MTRDQKLPLPSADKVFADVISSQDERDDAKREKVMEIPLSEIDPFPNHPFQVKNDDAMQNMTESVKTFGIQTPAIVRHKDDGRYELISGHRRKMASEIVGFTELPCIVRQLSDSDAVIAMVDVLDVYQAAALAGVAIKTVTTWARKNYFESFNNAYHIPKISLVEYLGK